jgi:hypothetical protein
MINQLNKIGGKMKTKNKFKEHSCEVKNEKECEEELDLENVDLHEEESDFYEDEDQEL